MRKKVNHASNILLIVYASVILFFTIVYCFFDIRVEMHDELAEYNPVYMLLKTGKMTAPSQGWFESMVFHPPIHYLEMAGYMKMGMNLFYAGTFTVFLLTCAILFFIFKGKFDKITRFSLLTGLFWPMLGGYHLVHLQALRPDYVVALSWYAGLIALEAGRINDWNKWLLMAGAFLITYASGVHYFAFIAFTGVGVYLAWVWREKGWHLAKPAILSMVIGGCIFGLPYLFFFVIPEFEGIWHSVVSNQASYAECSVGYAIARHMEGYEDLLVPFIGVLKKTFVSIGMLGALFLGISKETRGIALASLPLPLLIFLISCGKTEGYYIPEEMIYVAGLCMAILLGIKKIQDKLNLHFLEVATLGLLFFLFMDHANTRHHAFFIQELRLEPLTFEMHTSRACAKEIVGENALVGSRNNSWYVSGASHWIDFTQDLTRNENLRDEYVFPYLNQFDALTEYNAGANSTFNPQLKTLSSWYVDSLLELKGFYLTDNNLDISDVALMIFDTKGNESIKGYACRGNTFLYQYEADSLGDKMFAVLITPNDERYHFLRNSAAFLNIIPIPDPNGGVDQMGDQAKENLVMLMMDFSDYYEMKEQFPPYIKVRDEMRCVERELDKDVFVKSFMEKDQVIQFYPEIDSIPNEVLPNEQKYKMPNRF